MMCLLSHLKTLRSIVRMNNWKDIWNNRNISDICREKNGCTDKDILSELIKINGFDGGSGKSCITIESWEKYIAYIKKMLGIQDNDTIFEVGCGCGAILYPCYNNGFTVGGIDYSGNLIQYAKTIMPEADLLTGDASEINNNKYDFVISNSIFFYFSSYDYSSIVIDKMYDKAKKGIAILDIPDLRLKEQCERERRSQVPDYDEKYKGLGHLYYPKGWFLDFADKKGCNSLTFTQQNISGYGYNKYRFNCFIIR